MDICFDIFILLLSGLAASVFRCCNICKVLCSWCRSTAVVNIREPVWRKEQEKSSHSSSASSLSLNVSSDKKQTWRSHPYCSKRVLAQVQEDRGGEKHAEGCYPINHSVERSEFHLPWRSHLITTSSHLHHNQQIYSTQTKSNQFQCIGL